MKILIYNEDRLNLSALSTIVQSHFEHFEIKATHHSKALNAILNEFGPKILIYICKYPAQIVTDQLSRLKSRFADLKVLFISNCVNKKLIKKVSSSLVDAYIVQQSSESHLFKAIDALQRQETYVCTQVLNGLLDEASEPFRVKYSLTEREIEVLSLVSTELSTKQIADKLHVSHHTIETNKRQLMKKFNVRTSIGLVKIAMREGLAF